MTYGESTDDDRPLIARWEWHYEPPVEPPVEQVTGWDGARSRQRRLIIVGVVLNLVLWPALAGVAYSVLGSGSAGHPTPTVTTPPPPESMRQTLERQAKAAVAGDESGWLAPVDQANTKVVAVYRHLYDVLRALAVTSLQPSMPYTPDCCSVTVRYGLCTQTATCPVVGTGDDAIPALEELVATITWQPDRTGRNEIESYQPIAPSPGQATQPLLDGVTMQTISGGRVMVAATADLAPALPQALADAQEAARNADQFARWVRPTHYVVYLADRAQWRTWFHGAGANEQRDVLGYQINDTPTTAIVVLNYYGIRASTDTQTTVLRHEFGHVVTLLGGEMFGDDVLAEGIAEYIEENGRSVSQYDRRYDVAAYLGSHSWDGDPDSLDQHISGNDLLASSAAYGVGYLTWRCIASHFGLRRMFAFVGAAVHDGMPHDRAARATLGRGWAQVNQICQGFVRGAGG